MIQSRKELYRVINLEKQLYLGNINMAKVKVSKEHIYLIWRYVYYLRQCEYYINKSGVFSKLILLFYRRKKNNLGVLLNIEIHENTCGEGLHIYHGGVVINSKSIIGKNCSFHGMNCVGNRGSEECPVIGDNVDIGVGAMILGNCTIHSKTIVGANSCVIFSTDTEGQRLVGSPAHSV